MNDVQWNEICAQWQGAPAVASGIRNDFEGAMARRRRDDWHDFVALLVAGSLPGWLLVLDPNPVVVVCLLFVMVFIMVSVVVSQRLKRKRQIVMAKNTTDFVAVLVEHHETEQRLHRYEGIGLVTAVAFLVVWLPWALWTNWTAYVENPWSAVIGIGVMSVILAGESIRLRRGAERLRGEAERLEELRSEYPSQ